MLVGLILSAFKNIEIPHLGFELQNIFKNKNIYI